MTIRYAVPDDVPALSAVEAECFPPAEAATAAEFAERVAHYGNHFWLMYEAEKLIAFVDGFVTDGHSQDRRSVLLPERYALLSA